MRWREGETIKEDFTVTDENYALISGLTESDFTWDIFDPDGNEVSGSITIVVSELGNGSYRSTFTIDDAGVYYFIIYNADYFPWGKAGSIRITTSDMDVLDEKISRILGLTQENFYIDETVNDDEDNLLSSRIRIYNDASKVGTDDGVIATYNMSAGYTGRVCEWYSMVKE